MPVDSEPWAYGGVTVILRWQQALSIADEGKKKMGPTEALPFQKLE
jgi:hypothetical protein